MIKNTCKGGGVKNTQHAVTIFLRNTFSSIISLNSAISMQLKSASNWRLRMVWRFINFLTFFNIWWKFAFIDKDSKLSYSRCEIRTQSVSQAASNVQSFYFLFRKEDLSRTTLILFPLKTNRCICSFPNQHKRFCDSGTCSGDIGLFVSNFKVHSREAFYWPFVDNRKRTWNGMFLLGPWNGFMFS